MTTTQSAYEDILHELRQLAYFAKYFIPSKIGAMDFEPNASDAKDLVSDLMVLARRTDNVVLAYGRYLRAFDLLSDADLKDHFTDQLAKALEGNATYCIESNITARVEEMREAAQ